MTNSAMLVLHFQNAVAHPRGVWGKNLNPQVVKNNSVENTREAISAARMRGMKIIYVNIAFRRGAPELPGQTCLLLKGAKDSGECVVGSWGAQVIDELKPQGDDLVIVNFNSDGFEGTDLDLILRAQKIDTLFFTGQCIEHVVGTTMKRAVNMGYQAILLRDCTSGFTDLNYQAMVEILPLYGTLITSKDFVLGRYRDPQKYSSSFAAH